MALVLPIEQLLEKVSENAPCGILDAVVEAQVSELDQVIKRTSNGDFHSLRPVAEGMFRGGRILDLTDKNGTATIELKPVKHLKVAVVIALCGLSIEGIQGFSDALNLIYGLLSKYPDNVYPLLEPGNPDNPYSQDDPYYKRVAILSPLCIEDPAERQKQAGAILETDSWRMYDRLLSATLIESDKPAKLTIRDCLSPWAKDLGLSLPPGNHITADVVHQVWLGAAAMLPRQRQGIHSAIEASEGIKNVFKEAPASSRPRLDYLIRILKAVETVLDEKLAKTGAVASVGQGQLTGGARTVDGGLAGGREEALRKLVEAAEYFRRYEPTSPLPLLIDRVKRLASLNFMDLLEELSLGEQAVPEFRKLAGIRQKKADSGSNT